MAEPPLDAFDPTNLPPPESRLTVLTLPGIYSSGLGHWQSRWEALDRRFLRVEQRDWERPDRAEWVAELSRRAQQTDGPTVIAAHSLGALTTAHWAAGGVPEHVVGALLVAPPDLAGPAAWAPATGYLPLPRSRLALRTVLLASTDDPHCHVDTAREFARWWGSDFFALGPLGHINADSNLGDWPEGLAYLRMAAGDAWG